MRHRSAFILLLVAFAMCPRVTFAQFMPKTTNIVQDIAPDGSLSFAVEMTFDAAPWRVWKAQVGDEPSRLRALMRHQFSAYVIDDLKLEKDDLNRTARVSMRSSAGPELRKDGRFRIPIEKEFRLVNNTGNQWFFSGNNPYANHSLQTARITVPASAVDVTLVGAGTAEQGLVYGLKVPATKSRILVIVGTVIAAAGLVTLLAGLLGKNSVARRIPSAVSF